MSVVRATQEDLGAVFADGTVPAHYGRPDSAHRAVRNGVGVTEAAYGVVTVAGEDRVEFVDDSLSNAVPRADGEGAYACLLDPRGRVEFDCYVYATGDRLLLFTPPDRAADLAADWAEKTFVQDVTVRDATAEFGVFGVHGPNATEKVASVLNGAAAPDDRLSFVRGRMDDRGVTVVRTDDPPGEEGYEVVCTADDAPDVFDTLLNRGLNAAPFGTHTWATLTLEAGTPLSADLRGTLPTSLGLRNAVDFSKGCFVGQEVLATVENRGHPPQRTVGLRPDGVPAAGAAVYDGDEAVGTVLRAARCPTLDAPAALALVSFDSDATVLAVAADDGDRVPAERADLPFVAGSGESARLPSY
ncbi:MAG: aminomethyltransferase family protein [Halobacteriaceae archaeon]